MTVGLASYMLLVLVVASHWPSSNPRVAQNVVFVGLGALVIAAIFAAAASLTGVVLPPWYAWRNVLKLQGDVHGRAYHYSVRLQAYYRQRHTRGGIVNEDAVRRQIFACANTDARLLEQRRAWWARLGAFATLLFAAGLFTMVSDAGGTLSIAEWLKEAPIPWPFDLLQRLSSWPSTLLAIFGGEWLLLTSLSEQRELYCRELVARLVADEHTP